MVYMMTAILMLVLLFGEPTEWFGHRWGVIANLVMFMFLITLGYEMMEYRYSNVFEAVGAFGIYVHWLLLNYEDGDLTEWTG